MTDKPLTPTGKILLGVLLGGGTIHAYDDMWTIKYAGTSAIGKSTQVKALVDRGFATVKEGKRDVGNGWIRNYKTVHLTKVGTAAAEKAMDQLTKLDGEVLALLLSRTHRLGPDYGHPLCHESHSLAVRPSRDGGIDVTVPAWGLLLAGLVEAGKTDPHNHWYQFWPVSKEGATTISTYVAKGYGHVVKGGKYQLIEPGSIPEGLADDEREAILKETRA